ncbi:MAG: ribosome recycling factor [Anaerolineae bacterium]|jgi:ribosome recycling factor|nr:ribosome recycling factor [Anaerolineae bacterium]
MVEDVLKEIRQKMKATLGVFEQDLAGLRSNRASTGLVDRLVIDYYGTPSELRSLANISTPEPMQILIRPFDSGVVKAIEKAIMEANIGARPNVDGSQIRINMPALTRERRMELVKVLHKRVEDARISLRNIRRSGIDDLKDFENEGMISEDDLERGEGEIQKLTDQFIAQVEELSKVKEKEMLEV